MKIIILLFIGLPAVLFGQSTSLFFFEEGFDFGKVKETELVVYHDFKFVNKGVAPVKILDVITSCGCTQPKWEEDSIQPGDTSILNVGFFPGNNPGKFHKSVGVKTNENDELTKLFIVGEVEANIRQPEAEFPQTIGNLRLKSKSFYLLMIQHNVKKERNFEWYNEGEEAIVIDKIESPEHIKVYITSDTIFPKRKSQIILDYNPELKNDFGPVSDEIIFYTNDLKSPVKKIQVHATIIENFEQLTEEERKNAPLLTVGSNEVKLGTLKEDSTYSSSVLITNVGKSDLIIRKIIHTCECTTSELDSATISSGGSSKLKINFDTSSRKGKQTKYLKIYSNSPDNPIQTIILRGDVN